MSAGAWILVASLVALPTLVAARRGRERRRLLREAMHELRRPLQALVLDRDPAADDPLLAQLRAALADLESAIEGRRRGRRRDRVPLTRLLEDAAARWGHGSLPIEIEQGACGALLEADPVRLGMALDNLIANGLEHGRGPVSLAASAGERTLRLEVRNGRRPGSRAPDGRQPAPRGLGNPQRGHGLRIAGREAASDHGTLLPPRRAADGSIVAAVELPRADGAGRPAR